MNNLNIYIARFVMEAETPLFIGSSKTSPLKDSLVQRDANGFPMIPGTTLAGVIRHALSDQEESLPALLMGSGKKRRNDKEKNGDVEDPGQGSPVKVSQGFLLVANNKVSEGLFLDGEFGEQKQIFKELPLRHHVALNDKGTAKKGQLYDHEVIYQGVQFVFELEAASHLVSNDNWEKLLNVIKSARFRLGAGTRNGFGLLKAVACYEKLLGTQEYLDLSPSLNEPGWWKEVKKVDLVPSPQTIATYTLELRPDPFFIFGSGLSDNDVDQTPVTEKVVTYEGGMLKLSKSGQTLIPGSSVKGAIAHRVAYHYNKKEAKRFATADSIERIRSQENEALTVLFGLAGEKVSDPSAGNVFFKDVFLEPEKVNNREVFNHVAIDRFTGGAMDGMLFSEKVSHFKEASGFLKLEIQLHLNDKTLPFQTYLEDALQDICRGLLPLGGMTTKGHGIFTGTLKKENK